MNVPNAFWAFFHHENIRYFSVIFQLWKIKRLYIQFLWKYSVPFTFRSICQITQWQISMKICFRDLLLWSILHQHLAASPILAASNYILRYMSLPLIHMLRIKAYVSFICLYPNRYQQGNYIFFIFFLQQHWCHNRGGSPLIYFPFNPHIFPLAASFHRTLW